MCAAMPAAIRVLLDAEAVVARARARLGGRRRVQARVRESEARACDPLWLPPVARRSRQPVPSAGRVLNLLESSLPHVTAGYAQRARALCAAQARRGLAPTVVTRLGFPASRGLAFDPVEHVDGVPCHRLWLRGLRHYTAIPRDRQVEINVELAAALAAEVRPALLWAATPHLNGLVGLALRDWLGVPLVYDVRGFPDLTWLTERELAGGPDDHPHAARLRAAEARCMREADAVVTLSETMRAEAVARGADPARVRVLAHAVEQPPDPGEVAAGAERVRERLGLGAATVVGHASTLRRYEGAEVLLRAVARARERGGDIACMIVGDGPARAALERLAGELALGGAVRFAGRVDAAEMPAHHAAADILAVPRLRAPVCEVVTPLKLAEAMAAGRAVVASSLAPLEEAAAGAARLVPPGNVDALAAELHALAADPAERARLGGLAREVALERHAPAQLDAALGDLLEELGASASGWRAAGRAGVA